MPPHVQACQPAVDPPGCPASAQSSLGSAVRSIVIDMKKPSPACVATAASAGKLIEEAMSRKTAPKRPNLKPHGLSQLEVAENDLPAAALFFAFISGNAPERLRLTEVLELCSAMQFYMADAALRMLPEYVKPLFSEGTAICGREVCE
jgi:hypothetical protein